MSHSLVCGFELIFLFSVWSLTLNRNSQIYSLSGSAPPEGNLMYTSNRNTNMSKDMYKNVYSSCIHSSPSWKLVKNPVPLTSQISGTSNCWASPEFCNVTWLAFYFLSSYPLPFSGLDFSFLFSAKLFTTNLSFIYFQNLLRSLVCSYLLSCSLSLWFYKFK